MYAAFLVVISFLAMEGVAWCSHRYLMHGALWVLHQDHHRPPADSFLEKNDLFFVLFAAPGIALLAIGAAHQWQSWHGWVGLGITVYGFVYGMVHELFIHRRIKIFGRGTHPYFVALRRAHKMHHKHLDKDDGECFGMLLVPWKYYREAWKERAQIKNARNGQLVSSNDTERSSRDPDNAHLNT